MNDAYEGKTVRLKQRCPICHGEMEAGYLLDRGESNALYQSEWAAGEPQHGRWWMMGGVKTKQVRRYAVTMLRCEACGYLAAYATTPLNDLQQS
jgi:hypothetical protein